MKYLITLIVSLSVITLSIAQNVIVKGRAVDDQTKNPIPGLTVNIQTYETKTNEQGNFEIIVAPGEYTMTISADEWNTTTTNIVVPEAGLDMGDISMKTKESSAAEGSGVAEISLSDSDVDNDKSGQNVSGLLHSTSDAFVSAASFNLSGGRFNVRGYDGESFLIFMNGLPMNDPENGRASYSEWGGLNNVTRNKESIHGLAPSQFSLGTVGGETNINTCAGQIRKQNNISYAFSNRSYNHRVMYTYSTGMMDNGWAFVLSGSKRWAENGYVDGTWYDAYSYFLGAEKKLSDKHSLALTALGSPYKRAMQAAATQEAYDLSGSNYYNPNWGYQGDEKRNAKIRNVHQPSIILTDNLKFSDKTKLTTSVGYSFGRFGTTRLNWYNANDPRPDYYRYLPSYLSADTSISDDVISFATNEWMNNDDRNQINWDQLYQVNYLANTAGQSARYILEEQRKDNNQVNFHTNILHELSENISISGGLMGNFSNTHNFKVINDLLGAEYWLDVDQFSERDFPDNPDMMENDLNNPSRKVVVGDIFGYDYNMHYMDEKLWGLSQFRYDNIEFFLGLQASNTSFWREGNMKNGRYPTNSDGNSKKLNFFNYSAKLGATYKVNGHNYFTSNFAYLTKAPLPENSFVAVRVANLVLPNLKSETNLAGEVNYIHKGQILNARLTLYETYFKDQTDIKSFYLDGDNTYVNMLIQGIDKIHQGIELGADVKINKSFALTGALNLGNYRYTSRPEATISYENGSQPNVTETIYCKYFYVPTGFQNAGSVGLKYNNSKYWFASLNANYYDKSYIDFHPEIRTIAQIENELGLGLGDPRINEITKQEKVDGGYTLDFSLGKSWKIGKYYLGLNLNINNLLDNQDLITGGYEQLRTIKLDDLNNNNLDKFKSKYYYSYGRTYFLMLSFRF